MMAMGSKNTESSSVVESMRNMYKSLPARPSIDDLEAAISLLRTVETEQDEIYLNQTAPKDELYSVHEEMKKSVELLKRKEAAHLVELDKIFQVFDALIHKASLLVASSKRIDEPDSDGGFETNISSGDDDDFSSIVLSPFSSGGGSEKLNLMKLAALIEESAVKGARVLHLQGKLMDNIEWLPLPLGKLSSLTELYLSENRIMALPSSIGNLNALTKLDIRANQLINLPTTFGELHSLTHLNLSANMLKSLPESFGNLKNLTNLDLSSNRFSNLSDSSIGGLTSLQRLIVETNDLQELPHAIGLCSSLVELRLDFNQLRALPEAIGKLKRLEILTLHYNKINKLPSTVGTLLRLRELDISFNELESIPETFCFALSLEKLNLGKNFADLRMLPESIGDLQMLVELDISCNQIKVLPDSFRFLSKLRRFSADETPLEVPPREIVKLGAQAVVRYMADRVKSQQEARNKRQFWSYICPLLCFGSES